jgi:endonuclease YncB( thermonuclease family)
VSAVHDANLFTSDSAGSDWPWLYQAKLTRIVDADTLVLDVDLGFGIWHSLKVRLLAVNAPEMNKPEGIAARNFAQQWFDQHGTKVRIQTRKDKADSFGRYLAWVSVGGNSLNEALLKAGHAEVYRG